MNPLTELTIARRLGVRAILVAVCEDDRAHIFDCAWPDGSAVYVRGSLRDTARFILRWTISKRRETRDAHA